MKVLDILNLIIDKTEVVAITDKTNGQDIYLGSVNQAPSSMISDYLTDIPESLDDQVVYLEVTNIDARDGSNADLVIYISLPQKRIWNVIFVSDNTGSTEHEIEAYNEEQAEQIWRENYATYEEYYAEQNDPYSRLIID